MTLDLDNVFKDYVRGRISKASYERAVERDKLNSAVGKRIKIIKQFDMYGTPGLTGEVIGISEKGNLAVKFDKYMGGHTCGGKVAKGYGYNIAVGNVKFID